MKNFLIIGMGRFGMHLAEKLDELGNVVYIVDVDKQKIDDLADKFEHVFVGDCSNESVLKEFGVSNFDVCVVAVGNNFEASLNITTLLKECGAKKIVSKISSDTQYKFMQLAGADEIVYPEKDIANKLATVYSAKNVVDYFELSKSLAAYEISVKNNFLGKSISELQIRNKYHANVAAIRKPSGEIFTPSADYTFEEGDHLLVICGNADIVKLTK